MPRVRLSAAVALVFVGGLAGCQGKTKEEERAERDGVRVSSTALPHLHYSPYYGGYVPVGVPIGGYSNGAAGGSYSSRSTSFGRVGEGGVARGGFGSTGRASFSASA